MPDRIFRGVEIDTAGIISKSHALCVRERVDRLLRGGILLSVEKHYAVSNVTLASELYFVGRSRGNDKTLFHVHRGRSEPGCQHQFNNTGIPTSSTCQPR